MCSVNNFSIFDFQSKVKQMYKPVVRSCKLKAEQTIKEWRSKMVKSEMDALQQEMQLMEKGVRQLKDAINSVDKQLENIFSGTALLYVIKTHTKL